MESVNESREVVHQTYDNGSSLVPKVEKNLLAWSPPAEYREDIKPRRVHERTFLMSLNVTSGITFTRNTNKSSTGYFSKHLWLESFHATF